MRLRCAWGTPTWAHADAGAPRSPPLPFLPVTFLIHSVFPLSEEDGLLCGCSSCSLLRSCPQSSSVLAEKPRIWGDGVRGTKPPEQLLGQPTGNGETLVGEVNRKQVPGTLADAFAGFREDMPSPEDLSGLRGGGDSGRLIGRRHPGPRQCRA